MSGSIPTSPMTMSTATGTGFAAGTKPARIPDFVHPPVPGETHPFYGTDHNRTVRLPSLLTEPEPTPEQLAAHARLFTAAECGATRIVRDILTGPEEIDVNAPFTQSGMTPMQYAASRGHLEVVQMLADQFNAFVDIADKEGETALLKAAYNGHLPVVQCLVQRRANVHHRDRDGWTALHNACGRGHLRIVQHLVEHGSANIDVQSQQGHTPLMNAASKGFSEIVAYLLGPASANPLIKNHNGENAYDAAAANQQSYVCEMLETAEREWWSRFDNTDGRLSSYDLLSQHVTAMITIHENQRAATMFSRLLSMQPPKYSPTALTRMDPAPWTRPPNNDPCTLDDVQLPVDPRYQHLRSPREDQRAWFWLTDWQPDVHHPRTDDEGFEYAPSFMTPAHEWRPVPPQNTPGVRRRRYVRVMKRVVEIDGMDAANIAANNANIDSQVAASDDPRSRSSSFAAVQPDYIQEARTALEEAISEAEDSLRLAAQYEYAAIGLLDKARNDLDFERRQRAAHCARLWLERAENGLPGGRRRVALAKAFNLANTLLDAPILSPGVEQATFTNDAISRIPFLGTSLRQKFSGPNNTKDLDVPEPIRHDDDGFERTLLTTSLQQSAPPTSLIATDYAETSDSVAAHINHNIGNNDREREEDTVTSTGQHDPLASSANAHNSCYIQDAYGEQSASVAEKPMTTHISNGSDSNPSIYGIDLNNDIETSVYNPQPVVDNNEWSSSNVIASLDISSSSTATAIITTTTTAYESNETQIEATNYEHNQSTDTNLLDSTVPDLASPTETVASVTTTNSNDHHTTTSVPITNESDIQHQSTPLVALSFDTQPPSTAVATTARPDTTTDQTLASSSVLSSLLRHGQYSVPASNQNSHDHRRSLNADYYNGIPIDSIPSALNPSAWESDHVAATCRGCQRPFTLWIRRHHCRRCGLVFCNRCSMGRAIMMVTLYNNGATSDIEETSQFGPLLLDRFPSLQRVCDNCQQWLSSPSTNHYTHATTASTVPTTAAATIGTTNAVTTTTLRNPLSLSSPAPSIISQQSNLHRRNSLSSVQSIMIDCPVCGIRLDTVGEREQQEGHLRDCFEQPNSSARGLSTVSYAVHVLVANSPLLSKECPICFEEFESGHQVAHLNCLCIYHRQCIDSWLVRGHLCPVHGQ